MKRSRSKTPFYVAGIGAGLLSGYAIWTNLSSATGHAAAPPEQVARERGWKLEPQDLSRQQAATQATRSTPSAAHAVNHAGRRLMVAPRADATGKFPARIPGLEQALETEPKNEAWTKDILEHAQSVIPEDADVKELDVRCAESLCRIKIVKSVQAAVDWPTIDESLHTIRRGETFFLTESDGNLTTAYMYFAAEDGQLPFDDAPIEEDT